MRTLVLWTILLSCLFANGRYLSPIPLPKSYFIDLETYPCDNYCLQEHLQNGEIFSFLAKSSPQNIEGLQKEYQEYTTLFGTPSFLPTQHIHITILTSELLAPYTNKIIKSIMAYLIQKEITYQIETKIYNQTEQIQGLVDQAYQSDLIVLPLSFDQKEILSTLSSEVPIFVPTLHKSFVPQAPSQIFFGGADYIGQLDRLIDLTQKKVAIFYLKQSSLSRTLSDHILQQPDILAKEYPIDTTVSNLKGYLKGNQELNQSSVVLNTPIVKTALILSQLTLYDIEPKNKLSTQINYSPRLFTLTQPRDRHNLFLASSFATLDPRASGALEAFGLDPHFDWLSYATFVGSDIFFGQLYGFKRESQEQLEDHQIHYPITIWQSKRFSFEPIEAPAQTPEEDVPDEIRAYTPE